MPLSSIINPLKHFDQITDLVDHAAHFGRVDQFAGAADFAQAQTPDGCPVRFFATDGAADQLDLDGLWCSHDSSPGYAKISSMDLPRLAATAEGVVACDRASRVARTML